ncbi:MAG: thioredoxin family protein [Chloroflexi bacterium]|nr:thioredoxin family protein [Chloroflexota bacterium]
MAEDIAKVDARRFDQGLSYDQYIASIENNREDFLKHYDQVVLSADDRQFFANLGSRLGTRIKVLALAEDWCPDVVRGLPVAAHIAEACPDMELRVFPRDENLDLMDRYLNQGQFRSIPTFVFFDEQFRELGRWVERPVSANRIVQELKDLQSRQNMSVEQAKALRRQRLSEIFAERLADDTIREIREVLSRND